MTKSRRKRRLQDTSIDRLLLPSPLKTYAHAYRAIARLPESTRVEGIVHGYLHKEHMLKLLELSVVLRSPSLIGFSQRIRAFVRREAKRLGPASANAYQLYLMLRLPRLSLTLSELTRVAEKLPPSVFGTIDHELEAVVVLANALEGVETLSCCSGHELRDIKEGDVTHRAYFSMRYTDERIIDLIRRARGLRACNLDEWDLRRYSRPLVRISDPYPVPTYMLTLRFPTHERVHIYNRYTPTARHSVRDQMIKRLMVLLTKVHGLR